MVAGSLNIYAAELNDSTEDLSKIFTGDRFHEITVAEADNLFNSGESFILIYYSHQCGITLSRVATFQKLMDDYGVHIYGINGIYESGPRWMWDKFDGGIYYPVVCTVINNKDYTCLDGSYSLNEQVLQISDYMMKTKDKYQYNDIWQGFYELNSAMYNKARTDREALDRYLVSTEYIQVYDPEIYKLSKEIVAGYTDDYEKLKAIHDWVADNIAHDSHIFRYATDDYYKVSDRDYSAKGTLKSGISVCVGYANLTAALARSAGIPCKVVTGFIDDFRNSTEQFHELFTLYKDYLNSRDETMFSGIKSHHVWNEAFVNGRWVILDTTWDSKNIYSDGEIIKEKSGDQYFDIDLKTFSKTHVYWNSEFFDYVPGEPVKDTEEIPVMSVPNSSRIIVDGEPISIDAYTINGNNYFKLRDIAYLLKIKNSQRQFEIKWDNIAKTIYIITSESYTPAGGELKTLIDASPQKAVKNSSPVYLDGNRIELTAYTINSNNYFKLRDIASAVNFDVDWDGENKTIIIETNCDYTPD